MSSSEKKERTLLDMATINLKTAKSIYKFKTDDELFLNIVAYHIQQAIEMAIKHELELEGKTYPYSHDIGELIELSSGLAEFEEYEKLYLTASQISEFESHTRYDKNYLASAKMISILGPIAEKLLSFVQKYEADNQKKAQQELTQQGQHTNTQTVK